MYVPVFSDLSVSASSMHLLNVAGAFISPKGILVNRIYPMGNRKLSWDHYQLVGAPGRIPGSYLT